MHRRRRDQLAAVELPDGQTHALVAAEHRSVRGDGAVDDDVAGAHGRVEAARLGIELDARLGQRAGDGQVGDVDRADTLREELVQVDGEAVGPPGPDLSDLGPVRDGAIDPVALLDPDPLEERADRRLLDPVRPSELDRREREREIHEHGDGQRERVATWKQQEGHRGEEADEQDDLVDPVEAGSILELPQRQQHQGVRLDARLDEAVVRDHGREGPEPDRSQSCGHARSRCASVDPGQQGHEEERREKEDVSFLYPVRRELRRERGDDEQHPHGERRRCGEERLQRGVERTRARKQQRKRDEREDAEVEVELGNVPEQEPRDLAEVVTRLSDDLVRAEQARERSAAGELREDDERTPSQRDSVQQRVRAQPAAEQERRGQDREYECDRLHADENGARGEREHEQLRRPRRPLEHPDERPRNEEERGIEHVLGHHGAGVDHRRQRHREQRGEQREPGRQHAAGEQVGGNGRQ